MDKGFKPEDTDLEKRPADSYQMDGINASVSAGCLAGKPDTFIACTVAGKQVFKVTPKKMYIRGEKFESTADIHKAITEFFTYGLTAMEFKRGFMHSIFSSTYSRNKFTKQLVEEYDKILEDWAIEQIRVMLPTSKEREDMLSKALYKVSEKYQKDNDKG